MHLACRCHTLAAPRRTATLYRPPQRTHRLWPSVASALTPMVCQVLIASNEEEAERISKALDVGKGYMCTDTSLLASTFEKIFQASVAATS
jgi:hypothetical protein